MKPILTTSDETGCELTETEMMKNLIEARKQLDQWKAKYEEVMFKLLRLVNKIDYYDSIREPFFIENVQDDIIEWHKQIKGNKNV